VSGTLPETPQGAADFLKNRSFQLFQGRGTLAGVSYTLYVGTILWLTYRLSGGIFLAGVVLGIQTVVFALTFLISPIVDRIYDKRWVFVVCYPLQAALAGVLGVAFLLGALTLELLVTVVVLLALLWDFTEAADETTTRLLFGRDHLFVVTGLGSAIGGAVSLAIYFVAGAAIAIYGVLGGSALLVAIFLVATALAAPLPIPTPRIVRQSWWRGFQEGWGPFRGAHGKPLRQVALLQFAVGFFVPAPLLLLTLYAARFFMGSQTGYAELYVAYVIGGILAGLVLGRTSPRKWVGPVTLGAIFVTGLLLLGAEVAIVSLVLSLAVWTLLGATTTTRIVTWIYFQGRYDPEILARVTMNIYLFTGTASALGAFAFGALSATWSPQALTELAALGFLASAALGYGMSGTRTLKF
jgi:hypothetical protein